MQVGLAVPWTALFSELGYLKTLHGPTFLLFLSLFAVVPCLPVLIFQLVFDQAHNRRFGTAKAMLVRHCTALLASACCCLSLSFLPWSQ